MTHTNQPTSLEEVGNILFYHNPILVCMCSWVGVREHPSEPGEALLCAVRLEQILIQAAAFGNDLTRGHVRSIGQWVARTTCNGSLSVQFSKVSNLTSRFPGSSKTVTINQKDLMKFAYNDRSTEICS